MHQTKKEEDYIDVERKTVKLIKENISNLGFTEVFTYSLISAASLKDFYIDKKENDFIKLRNPISLEYEYMRSSVWPSLIKAL